MKNFCLTKELADKLKEAAVKGDINIKSLYEMSSKERNEVFGKYVDKDTATKVNAGFEQAMSSSQQNALKSWAEATFKGKTEAVKKDVFDKIDRLSELGLLSPEKQESFLSDLVATKLGIKVTASEASTISEKAKVLQKLSEEKSEFGTPTLDYFKAKKDIENYMESLTPTSRLRILTSTIGRGSMLFSLKSPIMNIESNSVQALMSGLERRIKNGQFSGSNSDYAVNYMKFVNKVFNETGYDLSRMTTLKDTNRTLGEDISTTQGSGKIRKLGRIYEDIVFKKLMSSPDVLFASGHFADSANLTSTKLAKAEGLKGAEAKARALEIFKDATSVDPKTKEGKKVREQAIADAEYATYTNESKYSDVALGIRKVLNLASGDLRIGDQVMPFVKTPANVLGAGVDASGVLLPVDVALRLTKMVKQIRAGDTLKDAALESFKGFSKKLVRAGLGTTAAFIISSLFKPEDFIGEYPTSDKEKELLKLKNATPNSVKIGDKWISIDYFGPLGVPLMGMLYAKKYGKSTEDSMFNYYVGVGKQVSKLPGLQLGKDIYSGLSQAKFNTLSENVEDAKAGALDYIRSRTVPAFVYDLAKATDKFERQVDYTKPIQSLQNTIPLWRQNLPVKKTILGDEIKTESPLSTVFFGSRVKTVASNDVIKELDRLGNTGNLPSISNSAKTSTRFKDLKRQIGGEKFKEAEDLLADSLNTRFERVMKTDAYRRMSDEKKANYINNLKNDTLEAVLIKYGYKKPKK